MHRTFTIELYTAAQHVCVFSPLAWILPYTMTSKHDSRVWRHNINIEESQISVNITLVSDRIEKLLSGKSLQNNSVYLSAIYLAWMRRQRWCFLFTYPVSKMCDPKSPWSWWSTFHKKAAKTEIFSHVSSCLPRIRLKKTDTQVICTFEEVQKTDMTWQHVEE